MVSQVYALSTAALSRRLRLVTVCSKRLTVSAPWVTCSVLVVAVWLLPLLDAGAPGVSFQKTFLCSRPSLCLLTWGVVCLALMYVVQCYMVRKLGPWLPTPFTDCVVTIVLWSTGFVGSSRWMTHQWMTCMPKLGICDLAILVRERQLRWFGHVMHSNGEINRVRSRPVPGRKGPGRPKKTWDECKICKCVVYLRPALRIECRGDHLWRTVDRSLPRLMGAILRAWLRLRHGAFWGCAPAPLTKLDLIDWFDIRGCVPC